VNKNTFGTVRRFLEENKSKRGFLLRSENFLYIDEIIEKLESDTAIGTVKASEKTEGQFYHVLEQLGILEKYRETSNAPRYMIKGDIEDFQDLREELEGVLGVGEVQPRKKVLRNGMQRNDKAPRVKDIERDPETPGAWTYIDTYDRYNLALIDAGFRPNKPRNDKDELEKALLKAYEILEVRPVRSEIEELTGLKPQVYERVYNDSLDNIMDEFNIPRFEDELDEAYETLVENSGPGAITGRSD